MNELQIETRSPDETVELGRRLGSLMRRGDVVALIGPLGAGKTQLVRGLAAGLGADPRQVASPTFILMSEYNAPVPLVHIDAYRIQGLADLESIGFTEELLSQSITAIEWADRIAPDLPADHLHIDLEHTEGGRQITLTPHGAFTQRRLDLATLIPQSAIPIPHSTCRTCGRPVPPNAPTFPFCSDRCKLVDLNRWFQGEYTLSRPLTEEDEEQ